jgi:hypothetical protein
MIALASDSAAPGDHARGRAVPVDGAPELMKLAGARGDRQFSEGRGRLARSVRPNTYED